MRSHDGSNDWVAKPLPPYSHLTIPLKWQEFGGNIKIHYSFFYIFASWLAYVVTWGRRPWGLLLKWQEKRLQHIECNLTIKPNLVRSRRWPTQEPRLPGPVLQGLGAPQGLDETTCFWKPASTGACPGANKILIKHFRSGFIYKSNPVKKCASCQHDLRKRICCNHTLQSHLRVLFSALF